MSRVYKLALHLAEREHADLFIVGMAALLHDLGHTVQQRNQQHHADTSVALASQLMQRYQVPAVQRQAIEHAIIAHSFSRGEVPRTLEACVVRDADRLDGLGAIGIMRWAVVGAKRSTLQTRIYHPDDPFAEQRTPDDQAYLVDHFYQKLLRIGEDMATETGRQLATQRMTFMRAYLDELKQELIY